MSAKARTKDEIARLIANKYAETEVGFHSEYRLWKGEWRRGAYAQIAAPYGGTIRLYARSYAELLVDVYEYLEEANDDEDE